MVALRTHFFEEVGSENAVTRVWLVFNALLTDSPYFTYFQNFLEGLAAPESQRLRLINELQKPHVLKAHRHHTAAPLHHRPLDATGVGRHYHGG